MLLYPFQREREGFIKKNITLIIRYFPKITQLVARYGITVNNKKTCIIFAGLSAVNSFTEQ